MGDSRSSWERLYQVAVKGAEYDSRERQPHPKCLKGTRVDLLDHIHGLLDNGEKSQMIWLHGTAGVGKSAVAFTVAERMKALKVSEESTEKRLAGSFFFSRKHTKRCTTGYFFATLVCQLASNFPSVREDVNRAIRENPALLDPNKSLRDQMEALFLQPLLKLGNRQGHARRKRIGVNSLFSGLILILLGLWRLNQSKQRTRATHCAHKRSCSCIVPKSSPLSFFIFIVSFDR